jgi:hypothetical protein
MAVKYKSYVKKMYQEHQELFDEFDGVHAAYVLNKAVNQKEYNDKGKEVIRVVEEWENRLCSRMEKGKNSTYSHRLADKFKEELRLRYSLIDFIGVEVKAPATKPVPPVIKKEVEQEPFPDIPWITFS